MPHYRPHRDPISSHQQIARCIRDLAPRQALDVGAAQGILGRMLVGGPTVLDAVEPHPEWAELARPLYRRVFACAIEQADLPAGTYDAIICADVLEHLADPPAALARLRRAATPTAAFIISVPNIAHLAVRLMLLAGRFPRMERGPLDRTHLHFFTRDTALAMIERAGLRVEAIRATGAPLDELWPRGEGGWAYGLLARLQRAAVRLWPRMFGYQWIFVARPAA